MNGTNIRDSFEYACEDAKKSFFTTIDSLNEAVLLIRDLVSKAKRNNKQTIYLTVQDAETLAKWLSDVAVGLQVDYTSNARITRRAMSLYKAGLAIENQCTCRHLMRCDRALLKWEEYKKNKQAAA